VQNNLLETRETNRYVRYASGASYYTILAWVLYRLGLGWKGGGVYHTHMHIYFWLAGV
jgi:hypothetical protein